MTSMAPRKKPTQSTLNSKNAVNTVNTPPFNFSLTCDGSSSQLTPQSIENPPNQYTIPDCGNGGVSVDSTYPVEPLNTTTQMNDSVPESRILDTSVPIFSHVTSRISQLPIPPINNICDLGNITSDLHQTVSETSSIPVPSSTQFSNRRLTPTTTSLVSNCRTISAAPDMATSTGTLSGSVQSTSIGAQSASQKQLNQQIQDRVTVKNKSEDFFRDCSSNLHIALRTINSNTKDWLDVGREGPHTGILLVKPGPTIQRPPRLVTIIGYVNSSYLARPSAIGSSSSSWSITLVISENTYRDLFQLVNTGPGKVQISKDGKANLYVPFRKIDDRYELKLKAKMSYFEAVCVAKVQLELVHERCTLNQCAAADGYSSPPQPHNQPSLNLDSQVPVTSAESASQDQIESDDELPDVEPMDWRCAPFPNIYDSTKIPSQNSEFVPTSCFEILPKCLVPARCFIQFLDFNIDGKQRTGYSLQLESLHLFNFSSDYRTDLVVKNPLKRAGYDSMAGTVKPNGQAVKHPNKHRRILHSTTPFIPTFSDL